MSFLHTLILVLVILRFVMDDPIAMMMIISGALILSIVCFILVSAFFKE